MEFTALSIPDLILVTPRVFRDNRGYFLETQKSTLYKENGIPAEFVQTNMSYSQQNVLRGLHFQHPPHAQSKLVQCLVGRILDVAVDIRQGSPTYGQWVSVYLDDDMHQILYVPEGFAHGFIALSPCAIVQYQVSAEYAPEADSGIRWDDPDLAISWSVADPILSEKDQKLPLLKDALLNFTYTTQTHPIS